MGLAPCPRLPLHDGVINTVSMADLCALELVLPTIQDLGPRRLVKFVADDAVGCRGGFVEDPGFKIDRFHAWVVVLSVFIRRHFAVHTTPRSFEAVEGIIVPRIMKLGECRRNAQHSGQ